MVSAIEMIFSGPLALAIGGVVGLAVGLVAGKWLASFG